MRNKIVVGFAVNTELVYTLNSTGLEKTPLMDIRFDLSGTSGDVALGLQHLGDTPLLLGLTGDVESEQTQILKRSLDKSGITFQALNALSDTSFAILRVDQNPEQNFGVCGKRGDVVLEKSQKVIQEIKDLHLSSDTLRIATGVRDTELPFMNALFEGAQGTRLLVPNWWMYDNKEAVQSAIGNTDAIFMNENEFAKSNLSLSELHDMGVKLIVVTQGDKGGFSSSTYKGEVCIDYYNPVKPKSEVIHTPGAGDWFLAGFLHKFMALGYTSFVSVPPGVATECVNFGASLASEKILYPGAGNGPPKR